MKIQSSWDDFCPQNLKLAELLKKYMIPAIFFIDIGSSEAKNQVKVLADMGFEIGAHTYSHPQDLKLLDDFELRRDIIDCRKELQEITGQEINWFCYPRGRYNEIVKSFVVEAGYKFARTTKVEVPWSFDPIEFYTSFHCFNRKEYNNKPWFNYAKDWLKFIDTNFKKKSEASDIHFWGHSHEIDKYGDWEKLEKLFKFINRRYI